LSQLDLRGVPSPEEALASARAALPADGLLEVVLERGSALTAPEAIELQGHGEDRLLLFVTGEPVPLLRLIGLRPPEPMERILEAMVELARGERLLAELPHEPTPFYSVLARLGASHHLIERPDGSALLCVLR